MSARLEEHEKKEVPSPSLKRGKFSKDSINDLIAWAIHLSLVVVSLTIVWTSINDLKIAVTDLVKYTAKEDSQRVIEVSDTKDTLQKIIEGTNNNFRKADDARKQLYDEIASEISKAAIARDELLNHVDHAESEVINGVQVVTTKVDELQGQLEAKVAKIQLDVSDSLGKINKIAEQIGIAAQQSQQDAQVAQTTATKARGALAHKTKQLSRANRFIKKQENRNLIQRIFNTQYTYGTAH